MFAALAAHGHTYPSIPLALAAKAAGHDVVFVAGEQFLPVLRRAGLDAALAGMSMGEAFAGVTGGADLDRRVGHVIGDVLPRRWVADLVPLLNGYRPDLLVHDIATLGAGLAAAITGVPAVGHTFGRISPGAMSDAMTSALAALRTELGVEERPSRHVDICPESVQSAEFLAGTWRLPLRPTSWSEPGDVPEKRDRPLVYLTFGTAYATADALRPVLDALAALPVDVLAATGPAVEPWTDPRENVRVERWVPQQRVLERADLVVHHGGSGTMLGAFAAAVPQVVLPRGADQFTNADAVVAAGVGVRAEPEEVAEQVRALLADGAVRADAGRLAAEVAAMPGPADVARLLPELSGTLGT